MAHYTEKIASNRKQLDYEKYQLRYDGNRQIDTLCHKKYCVVSYLKQQAYT